MKASALQAEQVRQLLKAHARTFALTLRVLPQVLREPLGLTYLLARASDTVADAPRVGCEQKLSLLEELQESLNSESFHWETDSIQELLSASEAELLAAVPVLMGALAAHQDREELLRLWRTILNGQIMDLTRFAPGTEPLSSEELEEYCHLVAGSVGETWTNLIALHSPEVLLGSQEELVKLGIAYGKGLQLLNIVRDRAEDRRLGRFYIREEEVPQLLEQTSNWLQQGKKYCSHLCPGRIRYASELPLRLALGTLERFGRSPESHRVKLSRWEVYTLLIRTLPSLGLPSGHNPAS